METEEVAAKPTPIQHQVARLQTMCDHYFNINPENELAAELAGTIVPELERARAQAQKEIAGDGITSETYQAVAGTITSGENRSRSMYDATLGDEEWIIMTQFAHVHVLMNETGVEDPSPIESHKCFPPGSICD